LMQRLEGFHGRPVQTAHSNTQKTCKEQINCCAKKSVAKCNLFNE
jgi:hypothetical protein